MLKTTFNVSAVELGLSLMATSELQMHKNLIKNLEQFAVYARKAGVPLKPYRSPEDVYKIPYAKAVDANKVFQNFLDVFNEVNPTKFGPESEEKVFKAFLKKFKITPFDDVIDRLDFNKAIEIFEVRNELKMVLSHVYFNMYYYQRIPFDLAFCNSLSFEKWCLRSEKIDKIIFNCVEQLVKEPERGSLWSPVPEHQFKFSDKYIDPSDVEMKRKLRRSIGLIKVDVIAPLRSEEGRLYTLASGSGETINMDGVFS